MIFLLTTLLLFVEFFAATFELGFWVSKLEALNSVGRGPLFRCFFLLSHPTNGCPAGSVIVTIISKLGDFTYLRDLQPTFIGVIIHLLSTMDVPAIHENQAQVKLGTISSIDQGSKPL